MKVKDWLRGLADARGLDEDAIWDAAQVAETATACDTITAIDIAPDQDLLAVQFSYFSIGCIGLGHALVHGAPMVFFIGQWANARKETPDPHPADKILDMTLEAFLGVFAAQAKSFTSDFEADKWENNDGA